MCARNNTCGITCERAGGKLGMLRICEHMPDSRNTNVHALFRFHNLKILGGPSLVNLIDLPLRWPYLDDRPGTKSQHSAVNSPIWTPARLSCQSRMGVISASAYDRFSVQRGPST